MIGFKRFRKKVAKKVYKLRIKKGLTQTQMKKFGISRPNPLSNQRPGVTNHRIANIFGQLRNILIGNVEI